MKKLDRLKENLATDKENHENLNNQLSSAEIGDEEKNILSGKIASLAGRIADKEKSLEQTLSRIAEIDADLEKTEMSTGD